eukprot:COSAG06_NODE_37226_length_437_cov_4.452663_1_plen_49_part_00
MRTEEPGGSAALEECPGLRETLERFEAQVHPPIAMIIAEIIIKTKWLL